ncbi:unnamed protein product [Urochloa humidicola]
MEADSRLTDKVGEDGSPDYFLVHCENEGTRLIHKDRWPVLKLPSEGRKEGTVNEEMKDLGNSQDSLGPGEIEEGGLFTLITQNIETEEEALEDYKSGSDTWVGSLSTIPRSARKRKFFPAVAARKSSRTTSRGNSNNNNKGVESLLNIPEVAGATQS